MAVGHTKNIMLMELMAVGQERLMELMGVAARLQPPSGCAVCHCPCCCLTKLEYTAGAGAFIIMLHTDSLSTAPVPHPLGKETEWKTNTQAGVDTCEPHRSRLANIPHLAHASCAFCFMLSFFTAWEVGLLVSIRFWHCILCCNGVQMLSSWSAPVATPSFPWQGFAFIYNIDLWLPSTSILQNGAALVKWLYLSFLCGPSFAIELLLRLCSVVIVYEWAAHVSGWWSWSVQPGLSLGESGGVLVSPGWSLGESRMESRMES